MTEKFIQACDNYAEARQLVKSLTADLVRRGLAGRWEIAIRPNAKSGAERGGYLKIVAIEKTQEKASPV